MAQSTSTQTAPQRAEWTGQIGFIISAIGFYDGFFGPGTGSFMTLTLVALGGLGLVRAIGNTKMLNLATNIAALLAMIAGGHVLWVLGLTMAAAVIASTPPLILYAIFQRRIIAGVATTGLAGR